MVKGCFSPKIGAVRLTLSVKRLFGDDVKDYERTTVLSQTKSFKTSETLMNLC